MTSPSGLQIQMEIAYTRIAAFAIELVDAMTMERVSEGITVEATGLRNPKATRNALGLFMWRKDDTSGLTKVSVDTGTTPYESIDLTRAQLQLPPVPIPLTTIQLAPAVSYSFARGVTGARGTLIEDRTSRTPVVDADVHLRWLDDDGTTWHDAPIHSHTTKSGDFVSVLRLASSDVPLLDTSGAVTVRLRVLRDGMAERGSADVKLPQGLVADPASISALTFAWDELQP
jgi:hypothetical protein